jgi:hypothetical protein
MRWDDERPLFLERDQGRGLAMTLGLPSSVRQSDVALRPAFLVLLQRVVDEAVRRRGPRFTTAGVPWTFPADLAVSVMGPNNEEVPLDEEDKAEVSRFTPVERGRYRIRLGNEVQLRFATIDANEVTRRPRDPEKVAPTVKKGGVASQVDASRELALIVLGLFAAEALMRAITRWRLRRAEPH